MEINIETKVIGRFHKDDNGTGLNIYNPYFKDNNINAVYILFKDFDPKKLFDGMRFLNLAGAITAGFETDSLIPSLVDSQTEYSRIAQRVGVVRNSNGQIEAHYQGGQALLNGITERYNIERKRMVIVGAGTVAKTFLSAIEQTTNSISEIVVLNRTVINAEKIRGISPKVKSVGSLDELETISGDILINASKIGSNAGDDLFTDQIIKKFEAVADVTFGTRDTKLIVGAEKQDKVIIDGWDMFTHQAAVVLKFILNHDANISSLRNHVICGLSQSNQGVLLPKK
jgi:shikimate 5-dehydrogenase